MKIENDKYYTPKGVAKKLIDTTFDILGRDNITNIIEPSAGNGSFSSQLPNCIAYDILPEAEGIKKQDFLTAFLGYKKGRLIIGNPPFGEGAALAIAFYKRAIEIGDYVAFVLPIAFYNSTITLYQYDLIYSEDLGELDYSGVKLHCCFNIYKRPPKGLNSKPNHELKDINIVEYKRMAEGIKKEKYDAIKRKEIEGHDFAICSFGGTGKPSTYMGQFCHELYIFVKNKQYYEQVKKLLDPKVLNARSKSIATPYIGRMQLYKYFKENIEGIE